MGSFFVQQSKYEQAEKCFEKAGTRKAYIALGKMYYSIRRLKESEQAFLKAKQLGQHSFPQTQVAITRSACQQIRTSTYSSLSSSSTSTSPISSPLLIPINNNDTQQNSFPPPISALTTLLTLQPHATSNSTTVRIASPSNTAHEKPTKFIRITHFDTETGLATSHSSFPDDSSLGNINIRAFRLRSEFPEAQVEIVETSGEEDEAPPRVTQIPKKEYAEQKIRDWLIVALSKLSSGSQLSKNMFNSVDKLPVKCDRLRAVLQQVVSHPLYRGQQMFLQACDGVKLRVEGGTIIQEFSGSCPDQVFVFGSNSDHGMPDLYLTY
jgi:tetratricopeptide (TPR) repeat protein